VVENVLAFYDRQRRGHGPGGVPAAGYRAGTLRVLFGQDSP